MAKLEIKVTGLDQLRAPGASSGAAVGADLARQLRVQGQLAERIARSLRTSIDGISTQLNGIGQTLTQSLSRSAVASAQAFNQNFVQNVQNNVTNISASYQQSMFVAIRNTERQALASSRRIAAAVGAAGRAFGSVGRGVGGGIAGAGSALGGGIGGLFGGGLGLSGLVRGAGGLASGVFGGLGSAAAGITGGIGGAVSGGLGLVPVVGPLLSGISGGITSAVSGGLKAAASVGSGVLDAATNLATSITSKLVSVIQVGLVAGLVLAVSSVAKASEFQRISGAFDGIAKSIGTDATTALEGFRTATRGTVSDLDLLTQANRAVILGAVSSQSEFEKLSSTAIQLGRATGRDAKNALEDLTLGIARQSKLILDNLGIIVDAEAAYQRYATSIGKTVFELTDLEKRQAFSAAAFQSAERAIVAIGKPQRDYAETVEQLGAAFENLQVAIGSAFLPVLGQITPELTRITNGIQAWLSDNNVQIAAAITSALQGIPSVLERIADFISGNNFETALAAGQSALESLLKGAEQALESLGATLRGEIRAAVEIAEFAVGDAGSNAARRAGDFGLNVLRKGPSALIDAALGGTPDSLGSRDSSAAANAAADAARASASSEAAQALQGAVSPIEAFTRGLQQATEQLNIRSGVPTELIRQELPPRAPTAVSLNGNEALGLPGVREAFPARLDQISREKTVRESLEQLSINISEFGALGEELVQAIADSSERTRAIREEASGRLVSEVRADYAERLEDAKEARDASRDAARELIREREEAKKEELDALERTREILRDLEREREAALATFREEVNVARVESNRRAQEATNQRVNQLAGFAGGLEGVSLPLNVFKAIEKTRREESKRVFDELRLATQGLSSNDLAANGGARLREVLTAQASRDIDAPGIRAREFAELEAESAKRLARAEEELALRAREAGERLSSTLERTGEVVLSTAEFLRELAIESAALEERVSEAERILQDFRRVERLARS